MGKVIVVGTLAFDTIETPYGKVERVIGGSAPFASLAAKTKNVECAVVSIVGNDFPKSYLDLLISKGIDISEVQIEEDGKSFFWSGKYHDNMNKRDTLETQVNVLANFDPKIPKNYTNLDILVLGNLDPKVQLSVISQFEKRPKFTMLDTMNFWMDNTLENLLKISCSLNEASKNIKNLTHSHEYLKKSAILLENRLDCLAQLDIDVKKIDFEVSFGRTSMEYYDGFVFEIGPINKVSSIPFAQGGRYNELTRILSHFEGQEKSPCSVGAIIRPEILHAFKLKEGIL